MRLFLAVMLLVSLVLSTGCTTSGDDITSPVIPSLQNTDSNIDSHVYGCRANMRTIAGQATIFFAGNNRYPSSLEEMGMAGVVCPTHGSEYLLIGTELEFYVECGLPQLPNHGNIDNGVPSWHNQHANPDDWEDICRANMRTIASQAYIFYAGHGYYPNTQEEIGMEDVFCPACGNEYELIGTVEEFFVGCPMPQLPNHGNIDNGVPSWHNPHANPDDWEDICRANMRTITSQAYIFYAGHGYYPNTQEEIGMEDVFCPACGNEYELIGTVEEFFVGCPMPQLPNHGNIQNGVASWHDEP